MKLNLLKMVIPLHCAQQLKQMGIRQQSLFYWYVAGGKKILCGHRELNKLIEGEETAEQLVDENTFSAFTTDELFLIMKDHAEKLSTLKTLELAFKYRGYKSPSFELADNINIAAALTEFITAIEMFEEDRKKKHQAPKEPENNLPNGKDH